MLFRALLRRSGQRSDDDLRVARHALKPKSPDPQALGVGIERCKLALARYGLPGDDAWDRLLLAGGRTVWAAGPLRDRAGLCHGTAGNAYAFLKLFERTGDEVWLRRARAFAMHAIEQVERTTAHYGRGRHSLWSGDPGTALNCE